MKLAQETSECWISPLTSATFSGFTPRRVHVAYTNRPALYNPDLAPIPPEKRSWGIYNYASLWVAMSVCIPRYMLASGLIAVGMNWVQAIVTILLGNLIVLIPMLLKALTSSARNRQ